jgi:hypothetical protein
MILLVIILGIWISACNLISVIINIQHKIKNIFTSYFMQNKLFLLIVKLIKHSSNLDLN